MSGDYHVRSCCPCGWSVEPSFGDRWFSDQRYPICPKCGSPCDVRETKTGRLEKRGGILGGWAFVPIARADEGEAGR